MQRETKLNYGYALFGLGMPYLIDYFLGAKWGVLAAILAVVSGMVLLIAGHSHREGAAIPARSKLASAGLYVLIGSVLGLGSLLFVYVLRHKESVPPPPPVSDLRVDDETLQPLQPNNAAKLNLRIFNDSQYTIHYRDVSLIDVADGGFQNEAALEQKERELWHKLEDKVAELRNQFKDDSAFYDREFPPKVRTLMTIQSSVLSAKQFKSLQKADGQVAIFYMSKFVYLDSTGEHGLDNCAFTQGNTALLRCTIGHSGPAETKRVKPPS